MKKIVIPIILAAILGIGGAAAVITMGRNSVSANADDDIDAFPTNVEVSSGKYYLNGDKESDLWIEVTPDYISLKGSDVDKSLKDAIVKDYEKDNIQTTDEVLNEVFEETKVLYCAEKIYLVRAIGSEEYVINVSRKNTATDREMLKKTNAAFPYIPAENTIKLALFGDFILIED